MSRKVGDTYKWKDEYYVRVYKLSREGMSDEKIANVLKVDYSTFRKWMKSKPALQEALLEAKEKGRAVDQVKEYVYGSLPPRLQRVWNRIHKCERGSQVAQMEAILENEGETARQHLFLYALIHHNFNPSEACRAVNISTKKLAKWVRNDPGFGDLLKEMQEHKRNFVEGALMRLVSVGDSAAIIFANKSLNKDRGYGTKVEIEHKHQGKVEHTVSIDDLGLSLKERRKLLDKFRERQLALEAAEGNEDGEVVEGEIVDE